ncbi:MULTISPECIES: PLP-dependent aminotransferase family protein [unclassified Microbacterium]|uniref:MocR-like pyridoxine biosynthesis transcription factor PdxR n=1 Tax=unclassified Microbacterium TaxID=2609290 RepID=UPI0012FAB943|nr:PLP-dependent aminotransferase family protein [Microbacterium sp. MAH-37]MVQ40831.1 aminotransferase class I/II-fold pyridoxal phosphate-dependent enzyme [Microbacterium sp. MAH-37]
MQNTRPIIAWETLLELAPSTADAGRPGRLPALRDRLEHALRDAIADGRLPAGAALPPSRVLADALGVSRWVVTETYGRLVAEGVLDARTGSATRVSAGWADAARPAPRDVARDPAAGVALSPAAPPRHPRFDLRPGIPDLRAVPRSRWAAALREGLAALPDRDLASAFPLGHPLATAAVAGYLGRSRLVDVEAARIVITHGATDGMALIASALRERGHTHVLVEDPSWPRLREVARRHGLEPVPVPVDAEGIDAVRLADEATRTGARAALLTPAHQFPLGVALHPSRRERLVAWAREVDGLLIEDDYDAEFRYDRRPIAALQRLAPDRVALIGSLSKSVTPALGVGWAVLPTWLPLADAPPAPSTIDQVALARFIANGDLERHLRSARVRFRRRRERLLAALAERMPDLPVSGIAAGMHLVLELPPGVVAADLVAAAPDDLALTALSRYLIASPAPEALVLGYGDLDDALVEEAVARLTALIRPR